MLIIIIIMECMWNVKANVIPVRVGANGTISKSFRKYPSNLPAKREMKELRKTAILGTAYILQKVVMQKYKTYLTWEVTLHVFP
jgi:hypothetical protein